MYEPRPHLIAPGFPMNAAMLREFPIRPPASPPGRAMIRVRGLISTPTLRKIPIRSSRSRREWARFTNEWRVSRATVREKPIRSIGGHLRWTAERRGGSIYRRRLREIPIRCRQVSRTLRETPIYLPSTRIPCEQTRTSLPVSRRLPHQVHAARWVLASPTAIQTCSSEKKERPDRSVT
jgi:hypothetical protein